MQPDPQLLHELKFVQRLCALVAVLLALESLCAWWLPGLRHVLPPWTAMKATPAVLVLASVLSMRFNDSGQMGLRIAGRVLAVLAGVVASLVLLEYAFHTSFGGASFRVDTLLASNIGSTLPGRMSPQTAGLFALLGVALFFLTSRKHISTVIADMALSALCLGDLVLASGYLFSTTHLFSPLRNDVTAPPTLLALMLLTFMALVRRSEDGVFVILLGTGIGSKVARIACPVILIMPFLLEVARDRSQRAGRLGPQYGAALETSLAAILALGLVLFLAWRIERLEREVRELSLRDALTGLYNRRGFYLFAERTLHMAQRARTPLSVLYIDLDNLKQINDSLGHDTGSKFLCEVSDLLKESFRKVDIIGRIGGDEFVVAGEENAADMHIAVRRMEEAAAERSAQPDRLYPFSFSLGLATTTEGPPETLDEMLTRADRSMYETKRRKKLGRK